MTDGNREGAAFETRDVQAAAGTRRHRVALPVLVAAIALGLPTTALGHSGSVHSYSCSDEMEAPHEIAFGKHEGYALPLGSNPPVPCDYYRSQVTTTSWSGGGGSGWYTHPISTSTSLWQTSWWNSISGNCTYTYIVRTGAQGKVGGTAYNWIYNTHGGGITCP